LCEVRNLLKCYGHYAISDRAAFPGDGNPLESGPATPYDFRRMSEKQVREILGKGLAKIAAASFNSVFPVGFQAVPEASRDCPVEGPVVASQLLYSRNYQVHSFLVMEVGQILKLGLKAFPKYGRLEGPRMVISANSEALNMIMAKIAFLVGKADDDDATSTTPPLVLNCTGPNRLAVLGQECIFLKLAALDISMLLIAAVQKI
jgi:hypothetical protein